jgi:hypothetical protein
LSRGKVSLSKHILFLAFGDFVMTVPLGVIRGDFHEKLSPVFSFLLREKIVAAMKECGEFFF